MFFSDINDVENSVKKIQAVCHSTRLIHWISLATNPGTADPVPNSIDRSAAPAT
jgi:hypothetical protein